MDKQFLLKLELKYNALAGVVLAFILSISYMAPLYNWVSEKNPIFQVFFIVLLVGYLFFAMFFFHKQSGQGTLRFSNAFGYGFKALALITFLSMLAVVILLLYVFPELKEVALQKSMDYWKNEMHLNEGELQILSQKFLGKYLLIYVISVLVLNMAIGIPSILIIFFILQKIKFKS